MAEGKHSNSRGSVVQIITGGRSGFRDLVCEGAQGAFENTVYENFYVQLREDRAFGEVIWSALTNTEWIKGDAVLSYSFRAAGDLIASMRREGDYLDWYCCARPGVVSPEIAGNMAVYGWTHRPATVD